ncbi:hypothetical protein BO79DRAFT_268870 [Aspergillus costaricaensis CBS 115574]|uniref:Uncharacterized protein n=1 Tax=Aspergillus costaricaensis CBS 115574 TaxID=1448317 RepID=A0ACD1IC51_9EURO|nr:hypothetical protein BO79DRAFT_268870 [Aspergillus costaricaensis CBS 115574]RAK87669.1 hypothetical protein BO79DRAFT_268870 [Aspergillus costaricaensis CBS 115574]
MMALWFIYTLSPVLLVFSITFFRSFQACSCRSHLVLLGWDVASTMIQGGCIARDCLVRESSPDVGSTAQPNADNPPAVRAPTQMNRTGHQMNGSIIISHRSDPGQLIPAEGAHMAHSRANRSSLQFVKPVQSHTRIPPTHGLPECGTDRVSLGLADR